MHRKTILLCWGTRPEALKMAVLAKGLKNHPKFKPLILVTGQHTMMTNQVMKLFGLKADFDLKVMTPNQTLASLSQRILSRMDAVLSRAKPDCVIVQGDTTTAFLTALSAFYRQIPVGHVEAGLRTDDKYQPFPEEINRRLITHVGEYHFAPTVLARRRLLQEGVKASHIILTGNTGIDALLWTKKNIAKKKIKGFHLPGDKKIVLVTAHRRESFGKPFKQICEGIRRIAKNIPGVEIYYPVHLNPNVQKVVLEKLSGCRNIHLLQPLGYDKLVYLMSEADLILTDSGGIQEEAPSFHKPILVMRNVTERPEGVALGFSKLVGQDPDKIYYEAHKVLTNKISNRRLDKLKNPYGDGKASARIIRFLEKML